MKNRLIIIAVLLLIVASIIFINSDNKKFYLEDEYYNNNGLVNIDANGVNELINGKKNFLLFVYNNFCQFSVPCENIFKEVAVNNSIEIKQISFKDFKELKLYNKVKYSPSIIIIKNGKIIDYLDTNSDNDTIKYQDVIEFNKWLEKYIIYK